VGLTKPTLSAASSSDPPSLPDLGDDAAPAVGPPIRRYRIVFVERGSGSYSAPADLEQLPEHRPPTDVQKVGGNLKRARTVQGTFERQPVSTGTSEEVHRRARKAIEAGRLLTADELSAWLGVEEN
jgi:hypothetical protein